MKKLVVILCSIVSLFSSALNAQTIQSMLDSIESNNTTLRAMRDSNEALLLENKTGLNLADPEVEFAYMWGQPADVRDKVNISVRQNFDFATLSGAKSRVAESQNALVLLQYKQDRLDILREARLALVNITYINAVSKLDSIVLKECQQLEKSQQEAFDRGESNVINLNKVKLDLLAIERNVRLNAVERESLILELYRLNGGKPIDYTNSEYEVLSLSDSFDEFYAIAAEQSPMLRYVESEILLNKELLSLNKSESLPSFTIGYVNELMKGDNHHGVAVGLSIPLWSNSGKVKAAKAAVRAAESRSEDAVTQFYAMLQAKYNKAMLLRTTAQEYATEVAKFNNVDYLRKALNAGQISVVDYINENKLYYDALKLKLEAERDYQLALAELYSYIY